MAEQDEQQEFEVTTTAQVERTYKVRAATKESAHVRVRRFIEDPDLIREGVVQLLDDRTTDATPQKVKTDTIKAIPSGPKAVDETARKAG